MTREALTKNREKHLAEFAALSFQDVRSRDWPVTRHYGPPGDTDAFYQVEARVLEYVSDGDREYVHVIVTVDDGRGVFGFVEPLVGSLFFHPDGHVETMVKS